jgi:hypothetical protein
VTKNKKKRVHDEIYLSKLDVECEGLIVPPQKQSPNLVIRNPSIHIYICSIFEKQLALEAKKISHQKKKTNVKKHQRHHPLIISKMIVKQNQGFF